MANGGGGGASAGGGGVCRMVVVVVNLMAMAGGGSIVGVGAWLATKQPGSCLQELHWPIVVMGVATAALSALAIAGAFFRVPILLRLYLIFLLLLVAALLLLALFTFIVTHKPVAKAISSLGYKQYRVTDFSSWLQARVNDPTRWSRFVACLRDSHLCFLDPSSDAFLYRLRNFLAADTYDGCCKPPIACGFSVSGTTYSSPTNPSVDPDCTIYNNVDTSRCFNCASCPAGILQSITTDWKKIALGLIITAFFLIAVYVIGSQAL